MSKSESKEKMNIFQCAYNCQNTEKTGQRLEIEIGEIFCVGRHDNTRDDRQNQRNKDLRRQIGL